MKNYIHILKRTKLFAGVGDDEISAMLSCLAFERYGKKDKVLVIINRNEHEIDYYLPSEWRNAQCIFGKEMQGDKAHLGAMEGIILKKEF